MRGDDSAAVGLAFLQLRDQGSHIDATEFAQAGSNASSPVTVLAHIQGYKDGTGSSTRCDDFVSWHLPGLWAENGKSIGHQSPYPLALDHHPFGTAYTALRQKALMVLGHEPDSLGSVESNPHRRLGRRLQRKPWQSLGHCQTRRR